MKILIAFALAFTLASCASLQVESDFNPATNFNQYKTWNWVDVASSDSDSPYEIDGLMENRIRNAITRELGTKGLQQVQASSDVMINYLTKVETKIDVDTFYRNYGYYPYYSGYGRSYRHGFGGLAAETRVRTYKEGTLIVDVIDSESKQLLWRGSATDVVRSRQTPEQRTADVNQAVAAILAQFPPAK